MDIEILTALKTKLEQHRERGMHNDIATPDQSFDYAMFAVIDAIEETIRDIEKGAADAAAYRSKT